MTTIDKVGPIEQTGSIDTKRPFSRADAVRAGIDPKLFRGSRFRVIFRGVYVDAAITVTPRLRVEAALVPFARTAFASHASAARVHQVPIPPLPDEHVTVLEGRHRRHRAGIRCHLAGHARTRVVDGVRVSDPAQMFVELATLVPLVELVVVGDNLVRRKLVTIEELRAFCAATELPGGAAARAAAAYVRERVDSPMETRLRMLLVLAGLPEPEVNLTLRAADGEPVRRHDLTYRRSRVFVEYDGRPHVERIEKWEADLERREAVEDDSWRIIVVTANGIYRDPLRTVLKVWKILRTRGEPGVPARPSDAWRPHFPGRD